MLKHLFSGLALALLAGTAMAQEAGGIAVAPAATARLSGLAQFPAYVAPGARAADIQGSVAPDERTFGHRGMIAKVRGDGGYLDGFAMGQPMAASRQPLQPLVPNFNFVQNYNGPITTGSGNITNYLVANGRGPIAQQVNICSLSQDGLAADSRATINLLCGHASNAAVGDGAEEGADRPRQPVADRLGRRVAPDVLRPGRDLVLDPHPADRRRPGVPHHQLVPHLLPEHHRLRADGLERHRVGRLPRQGGRRHPGRRRGARR